jgi:branched-chain amino acid transport system ATP-binding protein
VFEIRNLYGGWGATTVIEDVSLFVAPGETVSVIGRNGVGKSTLLELVVGRAHRHQGSIVINDKDVSVLPIHERVKCGLGYVPQRREVFPSLTVKEHFAIAVRPGFWTEEAIFAIFPSLADRRHALGRHLSGGEQQMLAIARALLTNPKLIAMDEPSEGLAPVVVDQLIEAIQRLGKNGLAILLIEQSLEVAFSLSNRVVIMDRGRIVHEGTSNQLRGDPKLLSELMGL